MRAAGQSTPGRTCLRADPRRTNSPGGALESSALALQGRLVMATPTSYGALWFRRPPRGCSDWYPEHLVGGVVQFEPELGDRDRHDRAADLDLADM